MLSPYWSTLLTRNWKLCPNSNWDVEDVKIISVSFGGAIIVIGITRRIELTEARISKFSWFFPATKLPFWSIVPPPLLTDQLISPVCILLPYWSTPLTWNWKLWPNSNWGIENIIISSASLGGSIIVIAITRRIELTEAII